MHRTSSTVLLRRFIISYQRTTRQILGPNSFSLTRSRSCFLKHKHPSITNMKFPSYGSVVAFSTLAITTLLQPSRAWVVLPRTTTASSGRHQQSTLTASTVRTMSAVPTEPSTPPAASTAREVAAVAGVPPLKEKAIAEGSIVTQFRGGLTALKINEDVFNDDDDDDNVEPISVGLFTAAQSAAASSKNSASSGDYQGKRVVFPDGTTQGVVVAHRPPLVFCYSGADNDPTSAERQHQDGLVKVLKSTTNITVVPTIRALDCFGRPLSTQDVDAEAPRLQERAIFSPIPGVADIALINSCMLTGTTMIDTLAPIGRGQNMLLVGPDAEQMRGLALDFIRTQNRIGNVKCIYAATDAGERERAQERLAGLDVTFVGSDSAADADDTSRAAAAVVAASTGCAVAESYALQEGRDTLVIVDNINLHKAFWDATTRVLVDIFGVDAVVQSDRSGGASSEMRGFFSSLIQRSSQYNKRRGRNGGSVTLLLLASIPSAKADTDTVFAESDFAQAPDAVKTRIKLLVNKKIPLTALTLLKIGIPIPSDAEGERRMVLQHVDDLISMSDGQIWLDERLEANGQQPPLDPTRSITRVGIGADTQSRADAPALRSIAEGLRLDLAQAMSLDGADATAATAKQRKRQIALLLAMYQKAGSGGRRLAESCCALLAAKEGYLDNAVSGGALAGTDEGAKLMRDLLDHVMSSASETMDDIDSSLELTAESRKELTGAIASFFEKRMNAEPL